MKNECGAYDNKGSTTTDQSGDGNALYKNNLLSSSFSELYHANSTTSGDDNTAYDPLGRITAFSRGTLTASGNNGTTLDTVTSENLNTLPDSSQSWSLDAVGNQTSTTTDGTATTKTQNSRNELTGVGSATLTYDNNGNTTTDASGNTLTYDAWNRMVTDSAGTTGYSYDANGRRITETHGSTTTDCHFSSQGQVIEERVGGTVTAQNVFSIDYQNDLLLRDDNSVSGNLGITGSGLGNRVYYQHDANFNVTATIDTGGNVINRYVYTPYGVQTVLTSAWASSSAPNSISGFQGGRFDTSTGLLRFGLRDYGPTTGVWYEMDPDGYINGLDAYQAFGSSPNNNVDPAGTRFSCATKVNLSLLYYFTVADTALWVVAPEVALPLTLFVGGATFLNDYYNRRTNGGSGGHGESADSAALNAAADSLGLNPVLAAAANIDVTGNPTNPNISIEDRAALLLTGAFQLASIGTALAGGGSAAAADAAALDAASRAESSPNIVYRAINPADAESLQAGNGLVAKAPGGTWTAAEHVANDGPGNGGAAANSPWISTSKMLDVAAAYDSGNGVIVIDLNKVDSLQVEVWQIAPRVNGAAGLPYHRSFWSQEVTIYKTIPQDAVLGFIPRGR